MSQMFGRDSRSPNPFQGGNNYGGSYNSGGGYNSYNSQKLGSYRVSQYDSTRISHGLSSVSPNWKEFTPMSINLREQTLHLSPIEQRVQDYYLIQKNMLEDKHKKSLETCIQKGSFNKMLLDDRISNNLRLLPYSNDPPINVDQLRGYGGTGNSRYGNSTYSSNNQTSYGNNSSGYNSGYGSNSGSSYNTRGNSSGNPSGNSSGNPFGSNSNNSSNPFTGGSSNNRSSGNPFGGNSGGSGNSGGYGTRSGYGSSYGSSGNYGNNSSSNSGNPFGGGNNNNSSYGNNSSRGGNPFGGNGGGNSSNNNPFGQNSSSGGGGNPFGNNRSSTYGNNSGNNNNPFGNRQNNSSNNYFGGNNGGSGSHNLFGGNRGGGGNNPFANYGNNGQGGGNNLFNNGFGPSGNSGGNNLFNGGGNNNGPLSNNGLSPEFYMMQMCSMMQTIVEQTKSKKQEEIQQKQSDLKRTNWIRDYGKSRENDWGWGGRSYYDEPIEEKKAKIIYVNNTNQNNQRRPNLYEKNSYEKSHMFRQSTSFNDDEKILEDDYSEVIISYMVLIKWLQNLNQEVEANGRLIFSYEPAHSELQKKVLEQVKQKNPWIKQDAQISLESLKNRGKRAFEIKGVITHRKINVPPGYDYLPHQFQGFDVRGLTISNKYGKVQWPQLINIKNVDFKRAIQIHRHFSSIQSQELEKYFMTITINSLPKSISRANYEDGRRDLQKCIRKFGDNARLINFNIELQTFTFEIRPEE